MRVHFLSKRMDPKKGPPLARQRNGWEDEREAGDFERD